MVRFVRFLDECPKNLWTYSTEWWSKFGIRKNGSHLHKFSIMINFGIKVCNKKGEILATCNPFFGGVWGGQVVIIDNSNNFSYLQYY